ncbi:beta strand repeat-containing protein [Aureimonas ureilytica]|uniref:beta strand repeat-containing protein n=1 Tax=Aureimonas ureilytica TaxID=401562 RepID=UPI003CECAEE3
MANTLSFDEQFYLSKNPDVAAAVSRGLFASGADHYNQFGRFEARNPNAFFDTAFYLGQYPDVAKAGINPLTHFLNFGVLENRATNLTELTSIDKDGNGLLNEFNSAAYLDQYKDVATGIANGTIKSAYQHFIQFGQFEGRVATLTNGTIVSGPFTNTGVAAGAGNTFTLTANADNFVGTANNDTFVASGTVEATNGTFTATTLNAADQINGAGGTDALNITVDGALKNTTATALNAAAISNVETLNVRNVATGTGSITADASLIPGLTTFNSDRSTNTVAVTNLANGATVGVIGDGVVTNGNTNFGYASATAAINLAISGGTKAGNITGDATGTDAATAATITSTGAANTVGTVDLVNGTSTLTSLTINAATNLKGAIAAEAQGDFAANSTLTVAGAATSVELTGALANALTKVDASGLTAGGLTATLGTGVTNFVGGAGKDVITTAATTATNAVISGGAGTADVLNLAATNDVTTTAKAAQYTNFEILRNSTTNDVDVSIFSGIAGVELNSADAGATKLTAAQAAAVTVLTDNSSNVFSLANATGTADVLKVTLQNTTATASADFASQTINGFETLQVVSSSGSSADINAVSFAASGAADLTNLTLSGAFPVSVNTANIAKAVTIDASGVTFVPGASAFALTLAGDLVKGSVVNGSAAADSIATTSAVAGTTGEFVTYNTGAGNDSISTTLAALNNTSAANASLKIDGGAGTDTLTFGTNDASFVDNNFQYVTGIEKVVLTNTTALSFTSGGYFNTNFAAGLDLTTGTTADGATQAINLSNYSGAAKITATSNADGATTADNIAISTGSGADTIALTAASFVGAAGAAGNINVNAGAGNDTISVKTGTLLAVTGTNAVNITGGAGADKITVDHVNAGSALGNIKFNIADGESTAAARDTITGFKVGANTAGTISDTLDLTGSATIAADTTGTNGADAGALKSHAISNGIVTFGGADTYAGPATVINQANLGDALSYLKSNFTTANTTVAFAYDSDSNGSADATIVFQAGTAGTVVELVGVVGASLAGTNGTANGLIHIA